MKLIKSIKIEGFRSIEKAKLKNLTDFTAIAGLNSAGKSNILRAISLFFTGETEPGKGFNPALDYHFSKSRAKKKVSITVEFEIPNNFHYHKKIKELLDKEIGKENIILRKEWTLETGLTPIPYKIEGDEVKVLTGDSLKAVVLFLTLIRFRFIPARYNIENEINSTIPRLIKLLAKKTNKKMNNNDKENLNKTLRIVDNYGEEIVNKIGELLISTAPGIGKISLEVPTKIEQLLTELRFTLPLTKHNQIEISSLGEGTQSFLTYLLCSYVDTSFDLDFGWKQAAIWAIEEPETSSHHLLNIYIGDYFRRETKKENSRFQVFATTHAEEIVKSSTGGVFVSLSDGKSNISTHNTKELLKKLVEAGGCQKTHPLLEYPNEPLIIVEGKYDEYYLKLASKMLNKQLKGKLFCLENLAEDKELGGNNIKNFIQNNKNILKYRSDSAPIIILYDWDKGVSDINKKLSKAHRTSCAIKTKEDDANPRLDKSWRGIERFLSTEIIMILQNKGVLNLIERKRIGKNNVQYEIDTSSKNWGDIKQNIYNYIHDNELNIDFKRNDFEFLGKIIDFVNETIDKQVRIARSELNI